MVKKVITILVLFMLTVNVFAEEIKNDIFQTEGSQKSAAKAMLFSAIIPGVGQFYSNPRSITAYIFPVLEFGLWYGYFYFQSEGDDITKQYEEYADRNYSREDQWRAQRFLILNTGNINFYGTDEFEVDNNASIFDGLSEAEYIAMDEWNGSGGHFRLDHENTQHFYEDIGKYDKYIFGWKDWTDIYATLSGSEAWTSPNWKIEPNEYGQNMWIRNEPTNTSSEYYVGSESLYNDNYGVYSNMRDHYIGMRQEAEDNYDKKRYCTFGLLFNHLLATIDAVRVTKKYNIEHLSQNPVDLKFATGFSDGEIQPALFLSYKF